MKRGKSLLLLLLVVQIALILLAVFFLWNHHQAAETIEDEFRLLKSLSPPTDVAAFGNSALIADGRTDSTRNHEALKEKNPDYIGWISIEGTNVDYPVMQASEEDPEFYLTHNFQKGDAKYGVPFLDDRCEVGRSDNLIIYGHHTADETMFSALQGYQERAFWEKHQTIHFETPQMDREYTVFAVLRARGTYTADGWSIFQCLNQDQREFSKMKQEVNARKLYETNLFPKYGEELLTLVTCEYSQVNSRLVILAYNKS